jgi:F0F1-type ATP synthase membrane subunit b/b'
MIRDYALMIHYEIYDQPKRIYRYVNFCIISSVASYIFWPPIVAIFRDVLFERYIKQNIKTLNFY